MTNLEAMIKAGDEQKCHVFYSGKHYFKFGSYWLVEDDGPVALRVYESKLIGILDELKNRANLHQVDGAPEVEEYYRCEGRAPYGCGWEGPKEETTNGSGSICPSCGQWLKKIEVKKEYRCNTCGWEGAYEQMDFIPPDITHDGIADYCPKCQGTTFTRLQ